MGRGTLLVILTQLLALSWAKIHFNEEFLDSNWQDRWVQTEYSGKEFGQFVWTAGKFYGDSVKDKGIQTSQDAKFYGLSAKFEDNKLNTEGKDFVFQMTVKHEQNIDCGGGYAKIYDCSIDQKNLHGESPYIMMFGPDICGPATKKVHVIFNYKGKNLLIKKDIRCKDDVFTHIYRLVVKPDNTYKVVIDGEVVEKGDLEKDWDFLAPKKIKDPEAKKPEDWDDRAKIDDENDKKPDDWEQPEYIPDPDATKPEDWDDEMDGEWEPPMINNPAYKGEWKPKQVDNPNYKGPWVHPEIDNPEYVPDDKLYRQNEVCAVGFDLWQVKAGTIFDNVMVTDDEKEADAAATAIMNQTLKNEKKMKDQQDEQEKKKEEEKKSDEDEEEPDEEKDDEAKDKDEKEDGEEHEDHDEL